MKERMHLEYQGEQTWVALWGGREIAAIGCYQFCDPADGRHVDTWCVTSYEAGDYDMEPMGSRRDAVACVAQLCN